MTRHICINAPEGYIVYAPLAHTCVNPRSRSPLMLGLDFGAPFVGFGPRRASHCLPTYSASHPASMLLSRLLIATPYNDSIMVRTPAPRDHPPAFVRYRLPRAPETCTPFTGGCMTGGGTWFSTSDSRAGCQASNETSRAWYQCDDLGATAE